MNMQVKMTKTVTEEFLSDILITAFDVSYGSAWDWFEPSDGPYHDKFWLLTKTDNGHSSSTNPWMRVRVRLHEETGDPKFDNREFLIDHEDLARGIERIINDDYEGVWRTATDKEAEAHLAGLLNRETREYPDLGILEVSTGETARGFREVITQAVAEGESGMIDAPAADCIVQAAVFGKVVFS